MLTRRLAPALCAALLLPGLALAGDHDDPFAGNSLLYRAATTGQARTFVTAVYVAGLTEALRDGGPITVFVPTDEAFAKVPEKDLLALLQPENKAKLADLLKYHVIKGRVLAKDIAKDPRPATLKGPALTIAANKRGVAVNEATVVKADLTGRNGVVHLIDRILIPPTDNVLSVARKAGGFDVLLKAIEVAGLEDVLEGDGPFTILAPTDEAFEKLGAETIEALLKDKKKLAAVLKYHVVPGRFTAEQIVPRGELATVLGPKIKPSIKGGRVRFNDAKASDTDIEAGNGIIHVIDAVLIPPDKH